MDIINLKSFAKVNIGLRILEKRPDGYHNIHTLFQELDFHDSITLEKRDSGIEFLSNVEWLKNDSSNLCVKAWQTLVDAFGIPGVSIQLHKRIPAGSGLGGGSSNAATVLKGLKQLYELDISNNELEKLGKVLGADVPFFIRGGLQLGDGIGDKLTPLCKAVRGNYLLVMPEFYIDTKLAYSNSKKILDESRENINFSSFIRNNNISFELFENDFEAIAVPAYPEIGQIKETLRAHGARFASLSGSGSTVFGIFDEDADLKPVELDFSTRYTTFISRPNF